MKRPCRNAQITILGSVIFGVFALACAHKIVVEIPPRIDLHPYQTIGIVEFASNSTAKLNQLATQQFMNVIQNAQPQVRFLELGPEEQALKLVGRERPDPDAMKALGKKYGVTTIFTGTYEISDVKPKVSLGTDFSSVSASAVVNISMASKHWDTASGATVWTNSRHGQWPLASVHKGSNTPISFNLSTPEDQYGRFIEKLVYAVTDDFRSHYEEREAPKQ